MKIEIGTTLIVEPNCYYMPMRFTGVVIDIEKGPDGFITVDCGDKPVCDEWPSGREWYGISRRSIVGLLPATDEKRTEAAELHKLHVKVVEEYTARAEANGQRSDSAVA